MELKRTPQGLLLLSQFASFFILLTNPPQAAAADTGYSARKGRWIVRGSIPCCVSGVIRIDCGAREDYWDNKTNSYYFADDSQFVEYGETHNVSSDYTKEQIGNQLNTLKSFPNGKRNCYTMKPTPGRNTYYLVRAFFAYGNYDRKGKIPSFDLYIGVNYWATVNESREGPIVRKEVIHVSPTNDIDVCLVNTGHGIPYISLLEVLPLQNSRYDQTASSLLVLISRSKLGMSEDSTYIRYPDDIYGRSWFNRKIENSSVRISASTTIDSNTSDNTYKLPKEVLSSAVQAVSVSRSLVINMESCSSKYDQDHYVYLHFYDFESQNQQRKMNIAFNDGINVSFTLDHMKPTTVVRNIKQGDCVSNISITSTSDSQLPAMLNAYEIYRVLPQMPLNSPTDEGDVVAIRDIKKFYNITRIDWQGDPCRPISYTWQGLSCTNDNNSSRITSLNLSSCNIMGEIAPSFSNLTKLEYLDLSNNRITGGIPETLAAPEKLNYINLKGNRIKGPIPKGLEGKVKAGHLNLSADDSVLEQKPPKQKHPKSMSRGLQIGLSVGVPAVGVAITIVIIWKTAITFGITYTLKCPISIRIQGKGESRGQRRERNERKGGSGEQRRSERGEQRKESEERKDESKEQRRERDERKGGSREQRRGKRGEQRKESEERKDESREQRRERDERRGERGEQRKESEERNSESREQRRQRDEREGGSREQRRGERREQRKESEERKGESREQRRERDEREGERREQRKESEERKGESREEGKESDEACSNGSGNDESQSSGGSDDPSE